jgi:KDO2-lipid IV(A) lauroyltransferase
MRVTYFIVFVFIKLFALLPFSVLYFKSNLLYYLFYYVIHYRRKVVRTNIERSFPEMQATEKLRIEKAFYRNLCDILLEGIKGFTISEKSLQKRYRFLNPELMNQYYEHGIDIVSVGSHYANWEWGIIIAPLQLHHKLYAFYTPLSNRYLDRYVRDSRGKLGTKLISLKDIREAFKAERNFPTTFFFGADQSPSNPKAAYWMTFLNQDTPCMQGLEFFARRYKMPVVYYDVQRIKRGHYTVELKVLEKEPGKTESGEITEKYMRFLEQIIINKPEHYLWSHRRWKHQRIKD